MWYGVSIIFIITAVIIIFINRKIIYEKEQLFEEKIKLEINTVSLEERLADVEEEYRKYREAHNKEYPENGELKEIIDYNSFIVILEKEIERKKRKEELKFSVIMISIDFYDDYMQMYDKIEMTPLKNEIIVFLERQLRKIDTISNGSEDPSILILLPMTSAEGAVMLAARLQKNMEKFRVPYFEKKLVVTLTVSVCEVIKSEATDEIVAALYIMKKEGEEKGGNIVKIVKI